MLLIGTDREVERITQIEKIKFSELRKGDLFILQNNEVNVATGDCEKYPNNIIRLEHEFRRNEDVQRN